jgi:hypothetical protein
MSLFGITTLVFALGIITLALDTILGLQQANLDTIASSFVTYNYITNSTSLMMVRLCDPFLSFALTQSTGVQCIICDLICAWRTVIIWNKDKRVIAILAFFILVSTGT